MFTTAREAGRSLDSAFITRYTNDICELLLFLKCRDAVKKRSAPKEGVAEGDYDSYLGSVTTLAESTRSGAYLADN